MAKAVLCQVILVEEVPKGAVADVVEEPAQAHRLLDKELARSLGRQLQ